MTKKQQWIAVAIGTAALMLVMGCQDPEQITDAIGTTEQDTATQGTNLHLFVNNAPGTGTFQTGSGPDIGFAKPDEPSVALNRAIKRAEAGNGSSSLDDADAKYIQIATVHITTGGTTPTVTGTTPVTASPSFSAPFRVDPETGIAVPVGIAMPGGLVDQQASATGRGDVDADKTSQQEQRWAKLESNVGQLQEQVAALQALLAQVWENTEPADPEPAEPVPGEPPPQ